MANSLGEALAYYQEIGVTPDRLVEQRKRFEMRHHNAGYVTEPTEKGIKYIEKQREFVRNSMATPLSIESPKVTFEAARKLCWEIMSEKLAVDERVFSKEGNVVEVIPQLIHYFIGDKDCIYPLNKGIYLWGDTGIGKTFLMEIMQEMVKRLGLSQQVFKIYNTQNIAESVLANEKFEPMNYANGSAVFDDFGQEPQDKSNSFCNNCGAKRQKRTTSIF